jgi:hypothetical protein
MTECKHEKTRLLWSEPKEADVAFEIYRNNHPESNIDLKTFWERMNIVVCCNCGKEIVSEPETIFG